MTPTPTLPKTTYQNTNYIKLKEKVNACEMQHIAQGHWD